MLMIFVEKVVVSWLAILEKWYIVCALSIKMARQVFKCQKGQGNEKRQRDKEVRGRQGDEC